MSEALEEPGEETETTAASSAASPRARSVALDWRGLARAFVCPAAESECYLDTLTGEVVELVDGWSDDHAFAEQDVAEGLVSGRLLAIEPLPHETLLGWMTFFAESLEDSWPRDALREALATRSPARTFEGALGRFPRERLAWLAGRETRIAAVLRAWLEAKDLAAATEPVPTRLAP
jgi:hypothetical protein